MSKIVKQNMYRYILVLFGVRFFNALNLQFHPNSFIERCSLITLCRNNIFYCLFKNDFLALRSFSLAWSSHMKLLKANLFCVINIPKNPLASMQSSFNIEIRPTSSFGPRRLRRSLTLIVTSCDKITCNLYPEILLYSELSKSVYKKFFAWHRQEDLRNSTQNSYT